MGYISLAEYAQKHGKCASCMRRKAENGGFTTAVKIGRNWAIDEDEPLIDRRKKSD